MHLETRFPLTPLFFKHWSEQDTEIGVILAKARFGRTAGLTWMASDAPDLVFEDVYAGDPAFSALVAEQDVVPGKRGTDLIVHATARSPDGRESADWPVRLLVPERRLLEFSVRGPSRWQHHPAHGWQRTAPHPVREVPLTYDLAFGGMVTDPEGRVHTFENNPSGQGFCLPATLDPGQDYPVPQIGLLAEFMVQDPCAVMTVCGLGPIAKAWLPRRSEAGTFDDAWQRTRHPRMPLDYSLTFWNAAPKALQFDPPLSGNEDIVLEGVSHDGPVVATLPGVACGVAFPDGSRRLMALDTVTLDICSPDPLGHTLDLVWRTTVPQPDLFDAAEIVGLRLEDIHGVFSGAP